jgi:uncharacterized membrane protein YgcG
MLDNSTLHDFSSMGCSAMSQFQSPNPQWSDPSFPKQTTPNLFHKTKGRTSVDRRQFAIHRSTCNRKELARAAGGEQGALLVFRFLHPPWREKLCPPGSQARGAWEAALCTLQGCRIAHKASDPHGRSPQRCGELIAGVRIDLYQLFHEVCRRGGGAAVHAARGFRAIALALGVPPTHTAAGAAVSALYRRRLLAAERIELRRPRPNNQLAPPPPPPPPSPPKAFTTGTASVARKHTPTPAAAAAVSAAVAPKAESSAASSCFRCGAANGTHCVARGGDGPARHIWVLRACRACAARLRRRLAAAAAAAAAMATRRLRLNTPSLRAVAAAVAGVQPAPRPALAAGQPAGLRRPDNLDGRQLLSRLRACFLSEWRARARARLAAAVAPPPPPATVPAAGPLAAPAQWRAGEEWRRGAAAWLRAKIRPAAGRCADCAHTGAAGRRHCRRHARLAAAAAAAAAADVGSPARNHTAAAAAAAGPGEPCPCGRGPATHGIVRRSAAAAAAATTETPEAAGKSAGLSRGGGGSGGGGGGGGGGGWAFLGCVACVRSAAAAAGCLSYELFLCRCSLMCFTHARTHK